MILAAGLGKRMGELTRHLPKSLLLCNGKPLIVKQIENLVKANVTDIVINSNAVFAPQLQLALGNGYAFGAHIHYSIEKTLLNTGGGITKALPLLGEKPFIVTSADLVTDYPFKRLTELTFEPTQQLAHLVLTDNPPYHPQGDFGLTNGIICMNEENKLNYAGIGLFHPALFTDPSSVPCSLLDYLLPAIAANKVQGEYYTGKWHNIGTPAQLAACQTEISG